MSKIFQKIKDYAKENRIFYDVEFSDETTRLIFLEFGTYKGCIQLEKFAEEEDYSTCTTYISKNDGNCVHFNEEFQDELKEEEIEGILFELHMQAKEFNSKIKVLHKLFREIQEYVIEEDIELNIVDEMWNELDFNK
jgi:signal recognition particle GTPase